MAKKYTQEEFLETVMDIEYRTFCNRVYYAWHIRGDTT